MILSKSGESFEYEGTIYKVGQSVYANSNSDYHGLFGVIKEIRDGDDKDTENIAPDIYCSFDLPVLPHSIELFEKRFSELYGEPKKINDIALDSVIMAPDMIVPLTEFEKPKNSKKIYIVHEDWSVNEEMDSRLYPFTNRKDAEMKLKLLVQNEKAEGCLFDWGDDESFVEESSDNCYEAYLEGFYNDAHYTVTILESELNLSDDFMQNVFDMFKFNCRLDDFKIEVEDWEELQKLSKEGQEKLFSDKDIPVLIESNLEKKGYNSLYWEAVSEVAFSLLADYIKKEENNDKK